VVGSVVAVGAVVGGFLLFGTGGGSVGDDGKKYKLTSPETVASEYQKHTLANGTNDLSASDLSEFEKAGVDKPQSAYGSYKAGSGTALKQLNFRGVWGDVEDPEATVDTAFAMMAEETERNSESSGNSAELVGDPETLEPAGLEDAVMKCQMVKVSLGSGSSSPSGPADLEAPLCMWGDHSTVAMVSAQDSSAVLTGKGMTLDEAAELATKLRGDARVEIK